jgi:hypothetical protein
MTSDIAKIYATQGKSAAEARQKKTRMVDVRRIGVLAGRSGTCLHQVGGKTC